ncbi:MAG: glycoside hydrolase family 3 N-terminal domain-containing protein [Nakamurella sp.]
MTTSVQNRPEVDAAGVAATSPSSTLVLQTPTTATDGPSVGSTSSGTPSQVAAAAAHEELAVGVTVDVAPVFGVLPSDGGPSAIGQYGRSYGADPQRVARLVAAAVTGYQSGGVVASMKHFSGLTRIGADSHVTLPTLPVSCADWNAHEAIPAEAGVDAGALMVMTAHMLFPAADDVKAPASISPRIIQKLLHGDGVAGCNGMNFGAVTVTDSMQMEPIAGHYSVGSAAVAALNAGEDLLLMPTSPTKAHRKLAREAAAALD